MFTRPPVLPSDSNHLSRSWLFGAVVPPIYLFYIAIIFDVYMTDLVFVPKISSDVMV